MSYKDKPCPLCGESMRNIADEWSYDSIPNADMREAYALLLGKFDQMVDIALDRRREEIEQLREDREKLLGTVVAFVAWVRRGKWLHRGDIELHWERAENLIERMKPDSLTAMGRIKP